MMASLGVAFRDSGKNSEAEKLLTKALAIKRKISGEDQWLALCHGHLGSFYFKNRQELAKAEAHFLDASRIMAKVDGLANSALGNMYGWLIDLYRTTGEVEKEVEQLKKKELWEKLREDKEEGDDKEKKEEKQMKMTLSLEELTTNFVTVNAVSEPKE